MLELFKKHVRDLRVKILLDPLHRRVTFWTPSSGFSLTAEGGSPSNSHTFGSTFSDRCKNKWDTSVQDGKNCASCWCCLVVDGAQSKGKTCGFSFDFYHVKSSQPCTCQFGMRLFTGSGFGEVESMVVVDQKKKKSTTITVHCSLAFGERTAKHSCGINAFFVPRNKKCYCMRNTLISSIEKKNNK